jgi:endonuclease YncB( thermonuclease family)
MRAEGRRCGSSLSSGAKPGAAISLFSLCLPIILVLSLLPGSSASLDEARGVVTEVIDGSTFDLRMEKASSRTENSVERITLADVRSPDMKSAQGLAARDFTYAVLMGKRVYLDVDDLSRRGRDAEDRLVAVVYLTGAYGQPIPYPNFNLLLVESGHAVLANQTDNEFDPEDWREGLKGSGQEQQKYKPDGGSQESLLSRIEAEVGDKLGRAAQAAWDWLRVEMTNTSLEMINSSLDQALNRG